MFALGSLRYRERGQDTARAFASQPSRRPLSAGWNWDPVKNFSAAMAYKLQALQRCNRSLYLNVSRWLCSGRLGRNGHLRGKPRVNLPPIDFEQAAPAAHHGARRAFAAVSTRLLEMTPEIKIDCSRRAGARRVPAEVLRLRPRDNVRACGPPHLSRRVQPFTTSLVTSPTVRHSIRESIMIQSACLPGIATRYATSSMYSACLLHALRYFKRAPLLVSSAASSLSITNLPRTFRATPPGTGGSSSLSSGTRTSWRWTRLRRCGSSRASPASTPARAAGCEQ